VRRHADPEPMNLRKLIKDLRHKLRRDQDNLALRLQLADLYRDDGNHAEAVQTYREVAIGFWQAGRLDEAKVACRRALDLAPHDLELGAMLNDIKATQRAAREGGVGRDSLPQRRAQVWQTPSMPGPALDSGPVDVPADAAAAAADGQSERPSLLLDPPTPLPEPMALHDLPEDSLMAQQPKRIRASISGMVPQVPLPRELSGNEDDVLALAGAAAAANPAPRRPGARAQSMSEPAEDLDVDGHMSVELAPEPEDEPEDVIGDSGDELGEEEDTDVRLLLARAVPQPTDDGRASEDLTKPVLRISSERQSPTIEALSDDDRPGFVSGQILLEDEPGEGRDTHPTLPGSEQADAGDDPTWIKALPDAPVTPRRTTSSKTIPIPRRPQSDSSPVVEAPLGPAELLDETHPVELPTAATDSNTGMVAEAVDEDKILAEEAVEQPRRRRRSAPRTIMDMAPPVPSAAASVGARKAALSAVFPTFPDHVIDDLAEQVALRSFAEAEYVFREGEPGRACYVVASGAVRVLRRDPVGEGQGLVEVARLTRGALFGERALLADRTRQGAVQADGNCSLYEIPRRVLRELVVVHHALGPLLEVFYREHLVGMLVENVPFLRMLPRTWREALRGRFRPVRRASGETILRQGERSGGLYVVVLGSVEITHRPSVRRARLLATLSEGMYFGDMSRLDEQGMVGATVSAAGPVELAVLPADEFDAIVAERPMLWAEICERGQRRELERCNLLTGETSLL
jgi:CRP-like cAMP-binding protein